MRAHFFILGRTERLRVRIGMMKRGKREAERYLSAMASAVGIKLAEPASLYSGKEGHLRLARECGYALNDFNQEGQRLILSASYSCIYVRSCFLRPVLSAKQWNRGMKAGKGRRADE